MGQIEKPVLPFHEDFYYSDAKGREIPIELSSLRHCFLQEVFQNQNYLYEDKLRIVYALRLAQESHANQVRRERGLPYIFHPIEAALNALRRDQSASFIVWLLLHDTREDTWIRLKDQDFVQELFRGTVTETVTRKLSRFRYQKNPETGEPESVKISDKEYEKRLRSSHSAVKAKHFDTLSNLKPDGRRLDLCLDLPLDKAYKIIADIRKFIGQVENFLIPIQKDFYRELAQETGEMIRKVRVRIKIVEEYLIVKSNAPVLGFPVSTLPGV